MYNIESNNGAQNDLCDLKGGRDMFKKGKRLAAMALAAVMALSLCACGKSGGGTTTSKDDLSEEVNLKWYIMAQEPAGFDRVMEEANKYLKEKLNVNLELVCIQAGDYQQKTQMIMASQEEFDLMWMNASYYEPSVTKGAFLPLDELLETTPDLKDLFEEGTWDATRVNGEIYGVPMLQVLYGQGGLWFIKSIVDKYDLPVEEIKFLEDLTPIYQTVKDNEPADIIPLRAAITPHFDPYMTQVTGTSFYIDEAGKVTNKRELNIKNNKVMQEWYSKGFFPADVTTMTDENSLIKAGKIFSRFSRQLPGVSGKFKISNGYDVVNVATNEAVISRGSVQSTMTAISATSKHPERALKLLELMQTDKYLFNLMAYGIEGQDWEKDPENEKRIQRESGAYYVPEYLIGNQFLAYILPSYEDTVWEETIEENAKAKIDPNNSFWFDRTPVETELTNLAAISTEYDNQLSYSTIPVEETYAKIDEKQKLAGVDKVVDEIQTQYDAWKAQQ